MSPTVLGKRRDGKEVAADSNVDPTSVCHNATTTATNMVRSSPGCVKKKSSSSNFLPAVQVIDDQACSSCSRLESKRTVQGQGSLIVDEIARDLATAARTTRKDVMAGDLQERQGSAKKSSLQVVTKPHIEVSFTTATHSSSAAAACLVMDVARGDRREWNAGPHFHAPSRVPVRPPGAARGRQDSLEATKMADAPDTPICEIRAPRAPPRPVGVPCPVWAVLRNRTLNATRREPSIFRGRSQNELENGVNAQEIAQARQLSWHIFNRRIFGVREVPRRGVVAFPEWVMFSAGVPPSGLSEHSRWQVRLGRNRGNVQS